MKSVMLSIGPAFLDLFIYFLFVLFSASFSLLGHELLGVHIAEEHYFGVCSATLACVAPY